MQIDGLQDRLRAFAKARDWEKFHSPKNLATALSVEASELLEIFQWMSGEESMALSEDQRAAVADEIADVQIYLARIADVLQIDINQSVLEKIEKNERKYPAEQVKGSAAKYTFYDRD